MWLSTVWIAWSVIFILLAVVLAVMGEPDYAMKSIIIALLGYITSILERQGESIEE